MLALWFLAAGWAWAVDLVSGPVVEQSSTGVAVIRWETDVTCGTRVQFGRTPAAMTGRAGDGVGTRHEVVLSNLVVGVTYHYSVGTARYALATNTFTVATVPGGPAALGTPQTATPVVAPVDPPGDLARPPPARRTWGNLSTLRDHFERHGPDFGSRDAEHYAAQAFEFRQRAIREGGLAKRDEEGVVRIFDRRSGAFGAYNRDGTTKTYFKPQSRTYFERQPGEPFDLRTWKP